MNIDRQLEPTLAAALAGWLPRQRWFAGKGKTVTGVDVTVLATLPGGLITVATVGFADGVVHHYHLPLALRSRFPARSGVITWSEDLAVHDATADPEIMATLLRMVTAGRAHAGVRFTVECPDAYPGAGAGTVRLVDAEQSNTSVVFGDRYILKLFRRLSVGVNPELEVHRALCGDPHLPALLGAVEADLPDGPVTLGVLHRFVPDAVDGWRLALAELAADDRGDRFYRALRGLGASVAAVHARLAEAFGTAPLGRRELERSRAGMLARLDAAAAEVPALAAGREAARAVYESVDVVPGHRLQRVHGDLHLGQVLHTGAGWLLIDFEGEPAVPIEQRVTMGSPLRDVAGMLRSLDYAAHTAAAPGWASAARKAFLDGYRRTAGVGPWPDPALLRAHELDKAVYEVVYETRNRPDWVDIPALAVRALTAAG